ncbi:MAG: agmatinase family protein [Clostridia bacterium]|jgi:agmatinase|nr:agmatinase family protein [Clostridia bacterium]
MSFKELEKILISGQAVTYDPNHKGFLEFLVEPEQADVIMFGVPFDGGTQRHVGTIEGPIGIRKGLGYFRNYSAELRLAFTDYIKVADLGNIDALWNDYAYTFKNLDLTMKTILDAGKIPIMLGGDHSLTYQAIKSVIEKTGKKLGFIWLDNHLDCMDDYHGDIYHCGTPLLHLLKEFPDRIDPKNVVHIGSRGFQLGHVGWQNALDAGINLIGAEEAKFNGVPNAVKKALELAKDGTDAIYMTLDIDVADGIYAPGTQCNNPGGFNATELLYIVREVAKAGGVIGFDVMEVAPRADVADVTIQLAACCILEFVAGLAWRRKNGLCQKSSL